MRPEIVPDRFHNSLFVPLAIAALVGLSSAQAAASVLLPGDSSLDSSDLAPPAAEAGVPTRDAVPPALVDGPADWADVLFAASGLRHATQSSSSAGSSAGGTNSGFFSSPALAVCFTLRSSSEIQVWFTPNRYLTIPSGYARGLLRPPRDSRCGFKTAENNCC